jgi:hypothetical protein
MCESEDATLFNPYFRLKKMSVLPSCDLTANNTSLDMFCIISKMDLLYYIGKVCKKNGNTM